jgi:methionyl-tRNA formyltransferase
MPAEDRKPGEIISARKDGLAVACGGGSVYLIEILQPEGKRRLSAYQFSLGAKIRPGDELSSD